MQSKVQNIQNWIYPLLEQQALGALGQQQQQALGVLEMGQQQQQVSGVLGLGRQQQQALGEILVDCWA